MPQLRLGRRLQGHHLCDLRGLAVNCSVLRSPFVVLSVRKRIRLSEKTGLFVG